MNAYYHFHAHEIAREAATLNQHRCAAGQNALTEPQLEFLNPSACQHVSPYNRNFWPELASWLAAESQNAVDLPCAQSYRKALEPYLLRRVHMTADTWRVRDCGKGCIRLLLQNVRLTHVHGSAVGDKLDTTLDHLNIWVSPAWFNHARPVPGDPLALDGVLYQYASARQTRNIGLLPVLVMPESRKRNANWKNCAVCPDVTVCPGLAA